MNKSKSKSSNLGLNELQTTQLTTNITQLLVHLHHNHDHRRSGSWHCVYSCFWDSGVQHFELRNGWSVNLGVFIKIFALIQSRYDRLYPPSKKQ
jgi:hypothetical protein